MRWSLSIIMLLCTLTAWGVDNHCQSLKARYQLPQDLRELHPADRETYYQEITEVFRLIGPLQIGWVDLSTIKKEIRSVRLCVSLGPTALTGSGSRQGSVYFTRERIIVFNHERLVRLADTPEISLLLLHEILGALGYPDENYELTSVIYAQAQTSYFGAENVSIMREELGIALSTEQRRIENITTVSREGGVSGVGGGGDPESALIKAFAVAVLLVNPDYFGPLCGGVNNIRAMARFILRMRLESDEVLSLTRIPSGIKHFYYAIDGSRTFIQFEFGAWQALRSQGIAKRDERQIFIENLVSLSCALAKVSP